MNLRVCRKAPGSHHRVPLLGLHDHIVKQVARQIGRCRRCKTRPVPTCNVCGQGELANQQETANGARAIDIRHRVV